MKHMRLDEIFDIIKPVSLSISDCPPGDFRLISTTQDRGGLRTYIDVTYVEELSDSHKEKNIHMVPCITASVKGSLSFFVQEKPFAVIHQVFVLKPKEKYQNYFGEDPSLLHIYCQYMMLNKFRFDFDRQADTTLAEMRLPHPNQIYPAHVTPHLSGGWPGGGNYDDFLGQTTFGIIELGELFKRASISKPIELETPEAGSIPIFSSSTSGPRGTRITGGKHSGFIAPVSDNEPDKGPAIIITTNCHCCSSYFVLPEMPYYHTTDARGFVPKEVGWLDIWTATYLTAVIDMSRFKFGHQRKMNAKRKPEKLQIAVPVDGGGECCFDTMRMLIRNHHLGANLEHISSIPN